MSVDFCIDTAGDLFLWHVGSKMVFDKNSNDELNDWLIEGFETTGLLWDGNSCSGSRQPSFRSAVRIHCQMEH